MKMGNRAVVTVKGSTMGVYLHWNGGLESITAFLRAAKDLGVREPTGDTSYFYARFVQIASNFFGGTASIGVESLKKLDCDNGDNGLYVVGADFEIVDRKHTRSLDKLDRKRSDDIYAEVMAINSPIFDRLNRMTDTLRSAIEFALADSTGMSDASCDRLREALKTGGV
jgi:hypothetical protein